VRKEASRRRAEGKGSGSGRNGLSGRAVEEMRREDSIAAGRGGWEMVVEIGRDEARGFWRGKAFLRVEGKVVDHVGPGLVCLHVVANGFQLHYGTYPGLVWQTSITANSISVVLSINWG
jgi:hypothetical protein